MKIFYKKDYFIALEELRKVRNQLEKEQEQKEQYIQEIYDIQKGNEICLKTIEDLHFKIQGLNTEIKSLKSAKGGYARYNSKIKKEKEQLEQEIVELKQKLADSMTDKYLVRKIKAGKTPNTLKTKVRNSLGQSNIVKNLHKE